MKRFLPLLAVSLFPAPVNAAASTDTTRVALVIPVSCEIDVVGQSVSDNHLSLTLHRRCNTWHVVRVESAKMGGERAAVRFNHVPVDLGANSVSLPQKDRYFDGIDTLVVDMNAPAAEMRRYARSLRFTIEQS
jgi:hypothetical protein